MRIFRIQNKHGIGMYTAQAEITYCMLELDGRHPPPLDDTRLCAAIEATGRHCQFGDYNFGFSSLDQLRSWVYRAEWRSGLEAEGFFVVELETAEVYKGDTQAVWLTSDPISEVRVISWEEINS